MSWLSPLAAPYEAEGSTGDVVLLIHGWTGSPAHLRPVASRLEADGHAVVLPTLAGHGTSMEDMARTGRFHWMASASDAYRRAASLGDRIHLFGFSMGGLLSIGLAAKHPAVATLTLLNVPHKFRDNTLYAGRFLKHFKEFHLWDDDGRGCHRKWRNTPSGTRASPSTRWKSSLRSATRPIAESSRR